MNDVSRIALPLVVDLDGTLTPTDTLHESVISLIKNNPSYIFLLLGWLFLKGGRASFKQRVAERARISIEHLPWRPDLLAWLKEERSAGRRIILATAAHESIAHAVSRQLGLFDLVLATTASNNLKGAAKLVAIQQHVGGRFAYAGDSKADLLVWRECAMAIVVGASPSISDAARKVATVEREFTYPSASWRTWLRALRVHQWIKNLLIFVPLFTAFAFGDVAKFLSAVGAFLAFSLAASATYLLNDIWDLDNDRQHDRKKLRPFASAQIPILYGIAMSCALLIMAAMVGALISAAFAGMVLAYVVLTTAYSWTLKQYVLIDVMMLAILYTFRVLAGSVATGITVTPWLLAFSIFTFFSLALVKRCSELVSLQEKAKRGARGRDYQVGDLVVLWPLGVGASLCSVVIFGLYIGTPGAVSQYGSSNGLWLVGIGLLYWFARLWVKTARGEMHDDPIVFALRDFGSRVTVMAIVAMTMLAHFVE